MHGHEPNDHSTVTQPLFGRRLRGHFGEAAIGLDGEMIALLEKLLDVPGVAATYEGARRAAR